MPPSRFLKKAKTVCWLTICCFSMARLSGQIAVELEKENVLLLGMRNPITIIVNDLPDSCLFLRPDGGIIEKLDKSGHFVWLIPDTTCTNFNLEIIDSCSHELVAKRNYRTRGMSLQVILGGNYRSTTISTDLFKVQGGIAAVNNNSEFGCGNFKVYGFSAEFFSKTSGQIQRGYNTGGRFSGWVADKCQAVQPGDWVRFYDISYDAGKKKPTISDTDLFFSIK